jgi:hypothetical protein
MQNFNPQQPPGMFPAVDELEQRVHGVVPYVLGAVGGVGGYFWGIEQQTLPVALCVGLGLVVGLLLVPLFLGGISLLIGGALVAVAALGTFWLLNNDGALKHRRQPAPTQQTAPANTPKPSPGGLLDDLRKAVQ